MAEMFQAPRRMSAIVPIASKAVARYDGRKMPGGDIASGRSCSVAADRIPGWSISGGTHHCPSAFGFYDCPDLAIWGSTGDFFDSIGQKQT